MVHESCQLSWSNSYMREIATHKTYTQALEEKEEKKTQSKKDVPGVKAGAKAQTG